MNPQKDSPPSGFLLQLPAPDRKTLSKWLTDAVTVDAWLEDLVADRERWRQQGVTKVPFEAKEERRRAFAALSQLAPGALADLPQLTAETCRKRAQRYAHLARLEIDPAKTSAEDRTLLLRVLSIAAWKQVLSSPPVAGAQRRREQVRALVDEWAISLGLTLDRT